MIRDGRDGRSRVAVIEDELAAIEIETEREAAERPVGAGDVAAGGAERLGGVAESHEDDLPAANQ